MKVKLNGKTLEGSPVEILQGLMERAFFLREDMDVYNYLEALKDNARRFFGEELNITGNTVEEKAESAIREMARIGMLKIIEED